MALNKVLDCAIMLCETSVNSNLKSGYKVDRKVNENYLDNSSWNAFKCEMQNQNPTAYEMFSKGGGKELEERKSGTNTYPPKTKRLPGQWGQILFVKMNM